MLRRWRRRRAPPEIYAKRHADILASDAWLAEGYGSRESLWPRLAAADTLVYVDLPFVLHFWWVTKRFFGGWFATPEGWPERSPMLRSALAGYRNLWLCSKYLTPKYRAYVRQVSGKQVFHLRSRADIARFLARVERDAA